MMLRQSSRLANFSKNLIKNLPINPKQVKRYVADKCCPADATQTAKDSQFKSDAFKPPDFLPITAYRPVACDEKLGPGAHKCKEYKNPEYFAYNRFSFFELQRATIELAKCSEGGVLYEKEEEEEGESAHLGAGDICDYDGDAEKDEGDKGDQKAAMECKGGKEEGKQQENVDEPCNKEDNVGEKDKGDKCEK